MEDIATATAAPQGWPPAFHQAPPAPGHLHAAPAQHQHPGGAPDSAPTEPARPPVADLAMQAALIAALQSNIAASNADNRSITLTVTTRPGGGVLFENDRGPSPFRSESDG